MIGYGTTLEGNTPETLLPQDLVTPSETTNRLILLCIKVSKGNADPRALGIVLEAYIKELIASKDNVAASSLVAAFSTFLIAVFILALTSLFSTVSFLVTKTLFFALLILGIIPPPLRLI